jgi:asparagine synthase (glutamine-hydrolysing)
LPVQCDALYNEAIEPGPAPSASASRACKGSKAVCGIAGFTGALRADAPSVLDGMLSLLAHRGPDDRGALFAGAVALGHVRLAIIDLSSRAHQPFVTDDGLGALTYNGEVYNFRELRSELERAGIAFRSDSDTEVVLQALHAWGPERAVPRLNGMFAFAYCDRRDGSLWLARDRAGIKPLYVARRSGTLAFASEQKALFAHPDVACEADPHAVIANLVHQRLEGTMTLYQGVEAMLPGTLLRIRDGRESCTTYFDVLRDVDVGRIAASGERAFGEHAADFERRLVDSVRMHLVSDAPLATLCSGGLDSSLVTAIAREAGPGLVSYVADIEGSRREEVRRAQIVCDALAVELRPVGVDAAAYFRLLPAAILANDQPPFFAQDVAALVVAEAVHADGFKVVLTGDGADELFGGYDWHALAFRTWRRRRRQARWIGDNGVTRLLARFNPYLQPLDLGKLAGNPFASIFAQDESPGATLVDGARRQMRQARLFRKLEPLARLEDRAFLARGFEDMYVHLREHLGSIDKMTMHYSVEARVPFLENALIDFGLHLPVAAKYRRGVKKRLVRDLAERRLPREIVHLPKIGFAVDSGMWSGTTALLRDGRLAEMLKWRAQDQGDILDLLAAHPDYQFTVVAMESWLRLRFGGESPERLSETLLRLKRQAAA